MSLPQRQRERAARRSEYAEWKADVLADGMEGFWPFSGSAGSTQARDLSGHDRPLEWNGAVALEQPGLIRGLESCATLDGATGYAERPTDDAAFDIGEGDAVTMDAWVVCHGGTLIHRVFSKAQSNDLRWTLYFQTDPLTLRFFAADSGGNELVSSDEPVAGGVYHVACVHDASEQVTLYVDGQPVASSDFSAIGGLSNTGPLAVGYEGGDQNGLYFNGSIQMPAFWSRALTDAEITALYEQGARFWDEGRLR